MFGNDKNKVQKLVGAKEKREKAMQFKAQSGYDIRSKKEGKDDSKILPLAVIYGLAAILALIMSEGVLKNSNLGIHTGNGSFDRLFFGPGYPAFTGSQEMDLGIVVFIRATLIFLLAGILPLLTYLWQKISDGARANIYLTFWGVTIALGFLYYLIRDHFSPALKAIIDTFFG